MRLCFSRARQEFFYQFVGSEPRPPRNTETKVSLELCFSSGYFLRRAFIKKHEQVDNWDNFSKNEVV